MNISTKLKSEDYSVYVTKVMPRSRVLTDCLKAFLVGGGMCTIGQLLRNFGQQTLGLSIEDTGAFTSIVLIFLGAMLTGLGIYDVIGNFAGAGSIVPITGFSNSVTSPAIEFRTEGLILGVGAKMFTIAGPVIVYGILASMVYGSIYWITTLF
ncbi:MAG: stage V sporulation protein AC [Clostridia bacterium]|nr:stage V sporulation protein AC [Clostridia bacterium]